MKQYVSIDIGGTAIKHGVINENGNILKKGKQDTRAENGGGFIVEKAIEIVRRYQKAGPISGICISTAGMVDVNKGEIV